MIDLFHIVSVSVVRYAMRCDANAQMRDTGRGGMSYPGPAVACPSLTPLCVEFQVVDAEDVLLAISAQFCRQW